MKHLAFLLIIGMSINLYGNSKKVELVSEIAFKEEKALSRIKIIRKGKQFSLTYKNNKKTQTKKINEDLANRINAQLNRFFWQAKYRKPASIKKCREYGSIAMDKQVAKLCVEHVKQYALVSNLIAALKKEF